MKIIIERSALWISASICLSGDKYPAAIILFGLAFLSFLAGIEENKKSK